MSEESTPLTTSSFYYHVLYTLLSQFTIRYTLPSNVVRKNGAMYVYIERGWFYTLLLALTFSSEPMGDLIVNNDLEVKGHFQYKQAQWYR